jgi:hypothetical protein
MELPLQRTCQRTADAQASGKAGVQQCVTRSSLAASVYKFNRDMDLPNCIDGS